MNHKKSNQDHSKLLTHKHAVAFQQYQQRFFRLASTHLLSFWSTPHLHRKSQIITFTCLSLPLCGLSAPLVPLTELSTMQKAHTRILGNAERSPSLHASAPLFTSNTLLSESDHADAQTNYLLLRR